MNRNILPHTKNVNFSLHIFYSRRVLNLFFKTIFLITKVLSNTDIKL